MARLRHIQDIVARKRKAELSRLREVVRKAALSVQSLTLMLEGSSMSGGIDLDLGRARRLAEARLADISARVPGFEKSAIAEEMKSDLLSKRAANLKNLESRAMVERDLERMIDHTISQSSRKRAEGSM